MIPALFTSSSALDANQTMLSVVGNNLANSNTAGFKSQSLIFSTQFSQILSDASQPTATNGGANPVQVGMGVQVGSTATNLTQGTFQATGNPLDLSIQNSGYFVLQDSGQTVYTRFGGFQVDSQGNLVDPSTGAKVQRVGTVGEATATTPAFQQSGNSAISIPNGLTIPGSATQNITFTGNLSANSSNPVAQVLTMSSPLTASGVAANAGTSLNALDQTSLSALSPTGYQAGDQILITGTRGDGTSVNAAFNLTGTASDTIGGLLGAINQAFMSGSPLGATATLNSSGEIVLTANQTGASTATMTLTSSLANASGTSTKFSNFVQTVAGADGTKQTSVIQVFDTQGTAHNVTFAFQKQANNTWNVTATMDPSQGTITGFGEDNSVGGIIFNANGSLETVAGNSTSQLLASHNAYTVGGVAATAATTLQSLDQHTPAATPYGATDAIQITGTDANGTTIVPITLPAFDPVTGNPATVGDILTAINGAYKNAIATLDSSGNIELQSTHAGQSSLSINIQDLSTNTGGSTTNFGSFVQAVAGTDGSPQISFQINNLAGSTGSQTINLNFGSPNGFDGLTQTGSGMSASAHSQDGYAQGTLQTTTVSADGIITGQFTNGRTENLAQIALATFTNPAGLQNAGHNYFVTTTASGLANIAAPESGGAGSIQSGGLEGSNVDVGTEFTNLIAAQRGYEVNAKAFSVANQLMQDSIDLLH